MLGRVQKISRKQDDFRIFENFEEEPLVIDVVVLLVSVIIFKNKSSGFAAVAQQKLVLVLVEPRLDDRGCDLGGEKRGAQVGPRGS
jgi:hypothetical protein